MAAPKGGSFSFLLTMMLAIVVYSIPALRDGIGAAMDMILGPIVGGGDVPWLIVILVLSGITGLYSSLLQKYTIDYEKMQRVQAKMRVFQKEFREAQLSGDEKRIKKLNEKRDKMMQEQLEMSQEQFKPMSYIMVVTIPIFLWLLYVVSVTRGEIAGTYAYDMGAIVFPYLGIVNFVDVAFLLPSWILWYMLCSLMLTQVIRKTLNIGGI
ncbi:MAG TPA: DUF106 domain-containing protein [Methanoculleus sp.]|nr:DUF106 domain-containing protein [Methanoculleus sp.]